MSSGFGISGIGERWLMDISVSWLGHRWRIVAVLMVASAMLMTLPYAMESEATSPEDEVGPSDRFHAEGGQPEPEHWAY